MLIFIFFFLQFLFLLSEQINTCSNDTCSNDDLRKAVAGIYLLTQQKKKLKQETETKDEHYWEPYRPYQQLTEKPVHTSDNSDKDTASEASSITDPENTESDPASSTK